MDLRSSTSNSPAASRSSSNSSVNQARASPNRSRPATPASSVEGVNEMVEELEIENDPSNENASRPRRVTRSIANDAKKKEGAPAEPQEEEDDDEDMVYYPPLEIWEVEKILARRPDANRPGKFEYRLKWLGWPSETNTWEPEHHLINCKQLLAEFMEEEKEREEQAKKEGTSRNPKRGATDNNSIEDEDNELEDDAGDSKKKKKWRRRRGGGGWRLDSFKKRNRKML